MHESSSSRWISIEVCEVIWKRVLEWIAPNGAVIEGRCRQTDRDRTDAQLARKTLPQFTQFLSEAAVIHEHALRPRQHAFTLGCESHESLTPLY